MSIKIVHISDTHGFPLEKALAHAEGNLLIHSGDLTPVGGIVDTLRAIKDLATLKHNFDEIILVPGNHDWHFEKDPANAALLCKENDIILLNDSGFEFDGIKIWGSPITPWFHSWAFNRHRGAEIMRHWNMIKECDVLITHGPPKGILDLTSHGDRAGCLDLLNKIKELRPILHLFGHIHEEGSKSWYDGITHYSNGSLMDLRYRFMNRPMEINIEWNSITQKPVVSAIKQSL